jgi:hypothetical protein
MHGEQVSALVRLSISTAAGIGAGIAAALIVAVIDLYLTGHGYDSITREVITWEQAGVHLSIGDLGMLITMIVAAVSTWYLR